VEPQGTGEILSHSLLGNVIRYRVRAEGVDLWVDVLNRSAEDLHPKGTQVHLHIAPDAVREVA
jgi:putative spermidine/putrescine transport system ATP-binding protein